MTFAIIYFLFLITSSTTATTTTTECPVDFTVVDKFVSSYTTPLSSPCSSSLQFLHVALASYLKSTSQFYPPLSSAPSCWSALRSALSPLLPSPSFNLTSDCSFSPNSISSGCPRISNASDFALALAPAGLADLNSSCNLDLSPVPACTACTVALSSVTSNYLNATSLSNVTTCTDAAFIYTAALVNRFGPLDNATASCLFLLNPGRPSRSDPTPRSWIYGVVAGCVALFLLSVVIGGGLFFVLRRRRARRRRRRTAARAEVRPSLPLESISASATFVNFSFEEIKMATNNFSRDNIIGHGGYGNVYKGVLRDGTELALKRFKNTTAAGDASFAHEVEVIASIRHVNLLGLRGYCIASTAMEGHQRIIVSDLMRNGSLHDHLFGGDKRKLSWPVRQRIAVGMARGLAYLHEGVQPSIIHRDIKASNILLDDKFEAKVADFGLARFAPDGISQVNTRVAGTLGYVAPEYALYGQLTEKSDVYSFGVVLLELLSGRKALVTLGEGNTFLVTDWAWSLVRKGKTLKVIEEGMDELGPYELLEKYVHIAVLCTHPQLHARPMMDQIVKILENDAAVPSIPDRPVPIISNLEEIERSMSSSGSGQLSSFGVISSNERDVSSHGSEGL